MFLNSYFFTNFSLALLIKFTLIKVYESWYLKYLATSGSKRETFK